MRAALVSSPGHTSTVRVGVPEQPDGQALVAVEGSGVCASSLPVWEGRPWFRYPLAAGAPGHEGWGYEVESGRRVAFLCETAFAEYAVVDQNALVPLPPSLDGAPFPGEALGCAVNAFTRSGVREADRVAIVGAGFLGLLLVQLAVAARAHVLAFSRRETALELARRFGAETPRVPVDEDFDVVIEAAGTQETLDLATRLCRVRGRLVIAGYHQDGPRSVDLQLWNWRGLDVVNAHERNPVVVIEGIRAAAISVAEGVLDPAPLYTHAFPLERVDAAFEALRDRPPGFVKALVMP